MSILFRRRIDLTTDHLVRTIMTVFMTSILFGGLNENFKAAFILLFLS